MPTAPATSKYAPLQRHLERLGLKSIPMTFAEIERIVGAKLPPSARKHRPWWSNNASNSVITHAWRNAGYKTAQVDMAGETLVFEKSDDGGSGDGVPTSAKKEHPIFGFMKGTVTIPPGVDLTEPADPDWGKVYDDDPDQ